MSSSSYRRRPRGVARDWAALPGDILLEVFFRLGPREVMLGAEFTCTAWRRSAVGEPVLWRRVGVDPYDPWQRCVGRSAEMAMRFAAVDRAAGQCEAFKGYCTDGDLVTLVQRAPKLKSLDIDYNSERQSSEELIVALKKLPLLEELEILILHDRKHNKNLLGSVCQACPHLKELRLIYVDCSEGFHNMESTDGGVTGMCKLRVLGLYECKLNATVLRAILDNCPLLESLHMTGGYFDNSNMDEELRLKCATVQSMVFDEEVDEEEIFYSEQFDY